MILSITDRVMLIVVQNMITVVIALLFNTVVNRVADVISPSLARSGTES
jgi:diacylglycerol kinase